MLLSSLYKQKHCEKLNILPKVTQPGSGRHAKSMNLSFQCPGASHGSFKYTCSLRSHVFHSILLMSLKKLYLWEHRREMGTEGEDHVL